VDAGGSIEVTGDGCAAGAEVVVTLDEDGRRIGGGTADADGAFALTLQIPSDLVVGDHPATATCPALDARARTTSVHLGGYQVNGQVATQHLRIRVVSARTSPLGVPAAEAGGSALARTGSDNGPLVAVGVLSVTVGAAFVYGSRRLRSAR